MKSQAWAAVLSHFIISRLGGLPGRLKRAKHTSMSDPHLPPESKTWGCTLGRDIWERFGPHWPADPAESRSGVSKRETRSQKEMNEDIQCPPLASHTPRTQYNTCTQWRKRRRKRKRRKRGKSCKEGKEAADIGLLGQGFVFFISRFLVLIIGCFLLKCEGTRSFLPVWSCFHQAWYFTPLVSHQVQGRRANTSQYCSEISDIYLQVF